MNRSKKYMMVAALATLSCGAMAQGLNTGYFIDGYTFRHNLNPAYGNDQNYVSIPALGNIQVRTQGNFGLGDVLFDNPRYGIDSDKKKTTFMNPYIADGEALKGFASGNNRINADVDITLLSAGFKAWGRLQHHLARCPHQRRSVAALRALCFCQEHGQPKL